MKRIHVVAAVIQRGGQILIARRPDHVHQGGKWEFPGGKVEGGESVAQALNRELQEELGISVVQASPLITIAHDYPDKQVLLDVWRVCEYVGEANGREGQEIRWVAAEALPEFEFPAANVPIVAAARLPSSYVITPELDGTVEAFIASMKAVIEAGHRLIQLRLKSCEKAVLTELVGKVDRLRSDFGATVLVNSDLATEFYSELDGVHLTSMQLNSIGERPQGCQWVAASCHNLADIQKAEDLGVDFITLSPYRKTLSHPEAAPITAVDFTAWLKAAKVPVYALGGVTAADEPHLIAMGAQGVAGIRGFWPN